MSAVKVLMAVVSILAVLTGSGVSLYRRRERRRFEAEFALLVEQTPLDLPVNRITSNPDGQAAHALERLDVAALPASDREYYLTCWEHIRGTFAHYPATALELAEHLTANLLLTRGLAGHSAPHPSVLPPDWEFPSAQGYRRAQQINALAREQQLPSGRLRSALMLYKAFFEEILSLPATRDTAR